MVAVSELSVSVIVAVRDGERYLGEALLSLLAQSPRPQEVIVIDDGSTDASRRIAEEFGPPVRVLTQPPSGIGAARNAGVASARGDLIAFLDADDLWPAGAVASRLRAFDESPAPDVVWGMVRHFRSPDLDPERAARLQCPPGLLPAHLPGGAFIARGAFERVGPFTVTLRVGEFVDWIARARELGVPEATVPDEVLHRRVHASNHTLRSRTELGDLTRVLRGALRRRRSLPSGGS